MRYSILLVIHAWRIFWGECHHNHGARTNLFHCSFTWTDVEPLRFSKALFCVVHIQIFWSNFLLCAMYFMSTYFLPTACMFLPGPLSTREELDVSLWFMPYLISDDPLGIFLLARPAITFQKLVQHMTNGSSQFRTFPNPMFSLMYMAASNNVTTRYLAIRENFLLLAIHITKNIPSAEGTLPDLPENMPSVPPGYVLFLLPQCQWIPIQV